MKKILFIVCLLLSLVAKSQPAFDTMRYVDFHVHSIMKNYFRNFSHPNDISSIQPGDTLNWGLYKSTKGTNKENGFNNLYSIDQATNSLLVQGKSSIICTSLYSLEKQALSSKTLPVTGLLTGNLKKGNILIPIVRYGPLFVLDHLISLRWVNKIAVTGIKKNRQKITYNKSVSNFSEFCSQLQFLKSEAVKYGKFKEIKLAQTNTDIIDTSKIWLVLTVEGAHNFYGSLLSDPHDIPGYRITNNQEMQILNNLDSIKNNYRLFFVTPAHLFENKISGGARGLDIDKSIFRKILSILMWDHRFSIVDNKAIEGINKIHLVNASSTPNCNCNYEPIEPDTVTVGWRFIKRLLEPNVNGKRTFIDMRHMDVKARIQIIDTIKKMNESLSEAKKIPLIVSHGAVSGKNKQMAEYLGSCPRFDDYEEFTPKKIKEYYTHWAKVCPGHIGINIFQVDSFLQKAGWFHPMSNNLFDEEIKEVYNSGGIIGITMEERALGKGTYNYKNIPEEEQLTGFYNKNYSMYFASKKTKKDLLLDSLLQAEPFVRNLFYIVENSGFKDSIKAWQHVAIGSDFDGMMNPIDICPTAAAIPKFYRFLVENLNFYADFLKKSELLLKREPAELLSKVFYLNGENFIKKYF